MTHRGDPAAWCAGSESKYGISTGRKIRGGKKGWRLVEVHETSGNSSFHRNCGNSLTLLPSNTRASLCVKRG